MKKYPESIEVFNKATEIKSAEFLKLSEHGKSLKKHKKFESAVLCIDEARHLESIPWQFWHDKGLAFEKVKKYKDATICFNRALKINPNSRVVHSKSKLSYKEN